ncbi:FtsX-like permease family protein [Edaphobacter modestus]|uniref:FtsX-like permease family protein n=1 Tax=Edaphobacter modestus TaxID=388466 RepID=A0A4Q7YRE2_9BACT|nr:FtsX-like permease family protein [Edaphobacter modestus]RZU39385.1 FtsX-like permease family protein [Edaphobacter modestus]
MWNHAQIFFRSTTAPQSLERPLRLALHKLNSEQGISGNEVRTLDDALSIQTVWVQQHMFSVLCSFFGGLALALSLFGITSTILFTAEQRKNELGIRLALGAPRSHIVWTVMQTLLPTITAAVLLGVALNLGFRNILKHWMPAGANSFWIPAWVTVLLILPSAIACLIPAVRAAYTDPLETLRND